jgi:hypothetical protein
MKRKTMHGVHVSIHENESNHPCVSMDDYEICDTIDDYLTETCDLNDEFLFHFDYPSKGHHMIEIIGETPYETVVAHILRLDLAELDQIYATQQ